MVCSSASLWHPGWGQPAGPWGVFEQPSRPQPRLRTSPNPQKKGGQWWDLGQLPGAGGMTHTICDPALGHRPQGACSDPQLKARSTVWGLHVEATGGQASCFWKVGREATSCLSGGGRVGDRSAFSSVKTLSFRTLFSQYPKLPSPLAWGLHHVPLLPGTLSKPPGFPVL